MEVKKWAGNRMIQAIITGPRQISSTYNIHKMHINGYMTTTPNTIANSEIDNHADTTCFGSNFTAIEFTGEQCEVSPLSKDYESMNNIPVATAATAWDDPTTGETIILVFHQGLWFGNKLPNSLINPNQCRVHGIEISDNPFDKAKPLGIRDETQEIHIPMAFGNSFVSLKTRAPSMDEIKNNRVIEMTSEASWNQPQSENKNTGSSAKKNHQGMYSANSATTPAPNSPWPTCTK